MQARTMCALDADVSGFGRAVPSTLLPCLQDEAQGGRSTWGT